MSRLAHVSDSSLSLPPEQVLAIQRLLLKGVQALAIAAGLLVLMRLYLLPGYGLSSGNKGLGLYIFMASFLLFALPWHNWLVQKIPVCRFLCAFWAVNCIIFLQAGWAGSTGSLWNLALSGPATALLFAALQSDPQYQAIRPNRAQALLLALFLFELVLVWCAAAMGRGQPFEAQWLARETLVALTTFLIWSVFLTAWRNRVPLATARQWCVTGALGLMFCFLLMTGLWADWLNQHSTHTVQSTSRWPIAVLLLALLALSAVKTVKLAGSTWVCAVTLAWLLLLPWVMPEQASHLLGGTAMMWVLAIPAGRPGLVILGWVLTLGIYSQVDRVLSTPLLLHGLSGTAILLITLGLQERWHRKELTEKRQSSDLPNLGDEIALPEQDRRLALSVSLLGAAMLALVAYLIAGLETEGDLQLLYFVSLTGGFLSHEITSAWLLRRQNLQLQQQSHADLLTAVLQRSRLGFVLFKVDGQHVWHNDSVTQIGNLSPDILSTLNLLHHPVYQRSGMAQAALRAIDGEGRQSVDYQGPGVVLPAIDVRWTVDLIMLSTKQYLLLQVEDLSETHAREAERASVSQAYGRTMANLKEELQTVLDTAWVGLGRTYRHHWVWVNQELAQSLGYTTAQLVGQPTGVFLDAQEHERIGAVIRGQLAQGHDRMAFEAKVRHKDGSIRLFRIRARILSQENIETIYAFQDVTEIHLQAKQLALALEGSEAASKAKSYFLSTMSHELRTPLNGIMGAFQILEWQDLDDKSREMVRTGKASSELLLTVLNDVLDYSRLTAGKLVLNPAAENLHDCLSAVHDMFAAMAQQNAIELSFDLDPQLQAIVLVDAVRLQQILMNLVNNALKFTEAGSVRVLARRMAGKDGHLLSQIEVVDTGIGMNEATIARLYEPFVQGDQGNTRRYQGTGLGLSIVDNLVKAMGGSIDVTSEPGVGTRFCLQFEFEMVGAQDRKNQRLDVGAEQPSDTDPIRVKAAAAVQPDRQPPEAHESSTVGVASDPAAALAATTSAATGISHHPLRGAQIAVVDDQPTNRLIARLLLQKAGATVHEFGDGSAFLRALKTPKTQFDAVLMDLQMEPMDGLQATRLIRAEKQAKWRTIPIVAMTGMLMRGERATAEYTGMNGFLAKPVNYTEMVDTLCRVMSWPH